MSHQYIDEYIKNYIQNDKSQSAIMLNAPWGCGKSYYIQNELEPYLAEQRNGGYECIIISLYGLSSIYEISKSVYLEIKSRILPEVDDKKVTKGKVVAKTVLKGVTSFFNLDLSLKENELIEFYRTVDLENKLLIFEDVERSEINIQELWGYINNLVEQDGAKVLLVANEEKYLKYEIKSTQDKVTGKAKQERIYDSESKKYLLTKEKTVGDTIIFHCDYAEAIKNILNNYREELEPFCNPVEINDLQALLYLYKLKNLRTFIFACQKTADILRITGNVLFEKKKCIFYSIIMFSLTIKSGEMPAWEGNEYLSASLGSAKYPLYRFCYDYIVWQHFDKKDVQKSFDVHKELILFNRHGAPNDDDLNAIYSYNVHTEDEVLAHLKNIENRLESAEEIPYYDYGKLTYYLAMLSLDLDFDYTKCVTKMSQNIKGKKVDPQLLFWPFDEFDSDEHKKRFFQIRDKITMALQEESKISNKWDYSPDTIQDFHNTLSRHENEIILKKRFISDFDINKLVDCVFSCNASQLQEFRSILFLFYRLASPLSFKKEDCEYLQKFLVEIIAREAEEKLKIERGQREKFDKIVLKQIQWLKSNIEGFIERMS